MKHGAFRVSPVAALALMGLWLLLNEHLSLGHVAIGGLLGVALSSLASTLRPLRARLRRLDVAVLLILVVARDVVASNLAVAHIVLRSLRGAKIRPAFLRVPLELRDPHGLAALAVIVTATPGTVWAGLSESGDTLSLHVLDLTDEAALIALIKQRYERPLMRIFQ